MTLASQIDRRQVTMYLQMQLPYQQPLAIQVIDGVERGWLTADAEWQALEDGTDPFVSGSNLGGRIQVVRSSITMAASCRSTTAMCRSL